MITSAADPSLLPVPTRPLQRTTTRQTPIRITEPQEMHRVLRSTKDLQCRTKITSYLNCDVSIPKDVKVRRSVDPQRST
jgi:hypothetical protein